MRNWRKTVNIKQFLNREDLSDAESGQRIVALLRQHREFTVDDDGARLDDLEDAAKSGELDEFNFLLDEVYDIADQKSVWLGL